MYFYESGQVKSMTLWPGEEVILKTNCGLLPARNGFSLYESGNIKSFEPAYELTIASPIGNISVYDETACGVNGDDNSLQFEEDGSIISFKTSQAKIAAYPAGKCQHMIEPAALPSPMDPEMMVKVPMTVTIGSDRVFIDTQKCLYEFGLSQTVFAVINDVAGDYTNGSCGNDCGSCSMCK